MPRLSLPGLPSWSLDVSLGPARDSPGLRLSVSLRGPSSPVPGVQGVSRGFATLPVYWEAGAGWCGNDGLVHPGPREALSAAAGLMAVSPEREWAPVLDAACELLSDPAMLALPLEVMES